MGQVTETRTKIFLENGTYLVRYFARDAHGSEAESYTHYTRYGSFIRLFTERTPLLSSLLETKVA